MRIYVDPLKYFLIQFYVNILGQYAFKIFNDQCPDYIHDLFQPCFTHHYAKRDTFLLYTPCGNIESNIIQDFNSLPFSLRHITSLYSFKKAAFKFYFLQV